MGLRRHGEYVAVVLPARPQDWPSQRSIGFATGKSYAVSRVCLHLLKFGGAEVRQSLGAVRSEMFRLPKSPSELIGGPTIGATGKLSATDAIDPIG